MLVIGRTAVRGMKRVDIKKIKDDKKWKNVSCIRDGGLLRALW